MPLLCCVFTGSGFSSASQFASALLGLEDDKKNTAPTDPHTRQLSFVLVNALDRGFHSQFISLFCSHCSSPFDSFPFPSYVLSASDGMAPKSSAALVPQTITLSPDAIAQSTRILHWFSQRDEQRHLSNLVSYQSGDRNAAAKRLLLDTVKLFGYEPSQTVEEIKQRVDDMVELYLHWRATAESVGWGTDPIGHDSKVDEAEESLTIKETILSFCYYYYELDIIMHGDPKIERSATSEKRPNLVMENHPSIGVIDPVSFRPRHLRSNTRAVSGQKVIIPRFSSEEPSDSKEDEHGTEDESTRGKRPAGMSIRKYWGLPSSSSGPEAQAPASQTSPDEISHCQLGVQEVLSEEFHDLLESAEPRILSTARKFPGEPSKDHQSGQDERPDRPEDIPLEKPLDKPQNKRQDKPQDRSQDESRIKAQEEELRTPRLSPHQGIPKDSKPASPSNEPLLLRSTTTAKMQTPKLELRPILSKTKSPAASASPSNEPLLLRSDTAKTQTHRIELRPIVPKPNSLAPLSLTQKDLSTDTKDHRAHLTLAHSVRANPNGTLHTPSFYAPINPPGISLDFYPRTTSFGPAQVFGDAHMSPQLASHQHDTTHTLPMPETHVHKNLQGGLLAFSDSTRDLLDQRALVLPPVQYQFVEIRPPITVEDDAMAVPAQPGNLPMLRQSPMIFPSSRSIFQPPQGPPVLIAPEPSSSRVAPNPAPMKRGREKAHPAANSNSDTPPLKKKKSRIGSPPKPTLGERLIDMQGLRSGKSAEETQQQIEGIYSTLEERQNEERQKGRYETRTLMETGKRLAEESNQAAEGLRKANAKLQEHLVVIATKAHEKIDAQAELFRVAIRQREQGSAQTMGIHHNNIGDIYHQEELIRRQDEMLRRMEEAIRRQDEKIEKMARKWEKKK